MRTLIAVCLILVVASVATTQLNLPVFRPATQLPATVNSQFQDMSPTITGDGLRLYWTSNRTGGLGGLDIWTVTRTDLTQPWGAATLVPELSSALDDRYQDVRDDDLEFFFSSNRTGTLGSQDVFVSTRTSTSMKWGTPTPLSSLVNTTASDADPTVTADGLELYVGTARPGGQGTGTIWKTTRASQTAAWTQATVVTEFLSTLHDHSPSISPDGLTFVFCSTRTGGTGSSDLYISTRPDKTSQWSAPVELAELNSTAWDHNGQFSGDGFSYYYIQTANNNLWVAHRILPMVLLGGNVLSKGNLHNVKIGTSFDVTCRRDPGDVGIIVGSLGRIPKTKLPPIIGDLEIDLSKIFYPPQIGAIGNMGRLSTPSISVPNNQVLNGVVLHWQVGAQAGTTSYMSEAKSITIIT